MTKLPQTVTAGVVPGYVTRTTVRYEGTAHIYAPNGRQPGSSGQETVHCGHGHTDRAGRKLPIPGQIELEGTDLGWAQQVW